MEATHDDVRYAVERRLVGSSTRSFPRPFTIYAANVEDVSFGVGDRARALTNAGKRNQRRRERGAGRVEPGRNRRANRGALERREGRRREVPRKTTRTRRTMPSTNGHANRWRERNWLPKRNTDPNTVLENSARSKFSMLLTSSEISEAKIVVGASVVNDQILAQ